MTRLGGGGRVIARFPGHCEECEHPIREGDEITPTEDGTWTHAKCTPPPDPLAHGDVCEALNRIPGRSPDAEYYLIGIKSGLAAPYVMG